MDTRFGLALLMATSLSACAYLPAGVPVDGPPDQVAGLVGEWTGSYSYEAGHWRSGSIHFDLRAVGDTARGDVLMISPPQPNAAMAQTVPSEGRMQPAHGGDQVLSITFVRAGPGTVVGELDPYVDPTCRCVLVTRFNGRTGGDTISGSFTARRSDTGETGTGRWKVTRQPR
jgi:hypothetical protein